MKFNCGKSREEKVRDHNARMLEKAKSLREEWRRCFAWFPIRVGDNDCRWLEKVEYRYPDAYVSNSRLIPLRVEDFLETWQWKATVNVGDVIETRAVSSP